MLPPPTPSGGQTLDLMPDGGRPEHPTPVGGRSCIEPVDRQHPIDEVGAHRSLRAAPQADGHHRAAVGTPLEGAVEPRRGRRAAEDGYGQAAVAGGRRHTTAGSGENERGHVHEGHHGDPL